MCESNWLVVVDKSLADKSWWRMLKVCGFYLDIHMHASQLPQAHEEHCGTICSVQFTVKKMCWASSQSEAMWFLIAWCRHSVCNFSSPISPSPYTCSSIWSLVDFFFVCIFLYLLVGALLMTDLKLWEDIGLCYSLGLDSCLFYIA